MPGGFGNYDIYKSEIKDDGSLGIPMTDQEMNDIIAFLKTLTDNNFLRDNRFAEF